MTRRDLGFIAVIVGLFIAADLTGAISTEAVVLLLVLVPSVILHEVSHGYVALLCGDDTAKKAGRLTLNPLAHIDPIGSILLPALLIFAGLTPIGYAKPVPVDVSKLHSPRNQSVLVSLAGPLVNLILSTLAGILLHFRLVHMGVSLNLAPGAETNAALSLWDGVLFYAGAINLLLGMFNLIPIPPLDGSAIIERILPAGALPGYFRLRMLMLPILIVLFLLFPQVIGDLFTPIINFWIRIFIP